MVVERTKMTPPPSYSFRFPNPQNKAVFSDYKYTVLSLHAQFAYKTTRRMSYPLLLCLLATIYGKFLAEKSQIKKKYLPIFRCTGRPHIPLKSQLVTFQNAGTVNVLAQELLFRSG